MNDKTQFRNRVTPIRCQLALMLVNTSILIRIYLVVERVCLSLSLHQMFDNRVVIGLGDGQVQRHDTVATETAEQRIRIDAACGQRFVIKQIEVTLANGITDGILQNRYHFDIAHINAVGIPVLRTVIL